MKNLVFRGRVQAVRRRELAWNRVEDRHLVGFLLVHVFFQALRLRGEDRKGERPAGRMERRNMTENIRQAATGHLRRDRGETSGPQ